MTAAFVDQATSLRTLAATSTVSPMPVAPTRRAQVIAITSGKGGVGKSNIAVNLAIKMASMGKSVALLDADLGLANADVLCNVEVKWNLSHLINRKRSLKDVIVQTPAGFHLIGGASGLAKMADLSETDRQRMVDCLAELETMFDVLLIDTGAGINANVLCFTRSADHVLIVTTPEPTAITDAYAVAKVMIRDGQERTMSLLVNQVLSAAEGRSVYERISKVARQFLGIGIYDAGYVFADENVPLAVRRRSPFTVSAPRCAASACVGQLAIRLQQGRAATTQPGGFFHRMSRWLKI
jgi:flagellar biosynthesis protein FlhG